MYQRHWHQQLRRAVRVRLLGKAKTKPKATGSIGYPAEGMSASYSGLCAFDCPLEYCPDACGTVSAQLSTPTVSEFFPPACIAGTGEGNLAGLCSFSCSLGHCPIAACTCTAKGALHTLPEATGDVGVARPGMDESIYTDLCVFTCMYGYCPDPACVKAEDSGSGSDGGDGSDEGSGSGDVYIDPTFFLEPAPVILPKGRTIYLYEVTTTIVEGESTIDRLQPSPITTSTLQYFNMPVHATRGDDHRQAAGCHLGVLPEPRDVLQPGDDALRERRTYVHLLRGAVPRADGPDHAHHLHHDPPVRNPEASSTSTSSGTPVPVWIQASGFYWSDMPDPTLSPGAAVNPSTARAAPAPTPTTPAAATAAPVTARPPPPAPPTPPPTTGSRAPSPPARPPSPGPSPAVPSPTSCPTGVTLDPDADQSVNDPSPTSRGV
ncbi:glycosyl hydrolase family 71-domain-containing protein [Aspergillus affinis]|uniref:glycosyl hydrolase family 71-domain-containing protein n=1 Tax=Aspergillus affinis TaxID=1070780 RepID=UPI0022FE7896|nr:glycosyl hydrolase family 71-domain-containing protein [Aspergillus affinis]KAI9037865.1 glycosyl hydrolase family 71-domain-containing protein [Aspergillus affinis]